MLELIGVAGMQRRTQRGSVVFSSLLVGSVLSGCTPAATVLSPAPQPSSSAGSVAATDQASDPLSLPDSAAGTRDCDAAAAQFTLGETATPAVIDAVKASSGASVVRVIGAGEGATRDFIAARVNIQLDAAGRISDIRCG